LRGFGHRSRFMRMGYDREDWAGRPVIAIINTWSDINPCHAHFKQRVEDVKRGVLQADAASRRVPVIASVRPSGSTYLMEDLYYAAGLLPLMTRLNAHLDLDQRTVSEQTWREILDGVTVHNDDVTARPRPRSIRRARLPS